MFLAVLALFFASLQSPNNITKHYALHLIVTNNNTSISTMIDRVALMSSATLRSHKEMPCSRWYLAAKVLVIFFDFQDDPMHPLNSADSIAHIVLKVPAAMIFDPLQRSISINLIASCIMVPCPS